MSSSLYFWIERASAFVIPSPFLLTSPLSLPCSVSEYLLGLESDCMMITASDTSTAPSQLASPQRVTLPGTVVAVVSDGSDDVTVVVVVVGSVVVVVVVSPPPLWPFSVRGSTLG